MTQVAPRAASEEQRGVRASSETAMKGRVRRREKIENTQQRVDRLLRRGSLQVPHNDDFQSQLVSSSVRTVPRNISAGTGIRSDASILHQLKGKCHIVDLMGGTHTTWKLNALINMFIGKLREDGLHNL
ncbi:hypothetical protein EYF80_013751 [Liparis tanakae]|uniref:Uncharacterized protein n=1 Tax=Liparis tanakae TaxID=230148 RepID=A0A4Z2IDC2_9TELE|nr:hypothetical protein EYF80_013751 [Liparis tanakae]